jgi:hypothetical protein
MNANNPENNNLLKKLYSVTAEHHPLVKTLIEDIFRCVNDKNAGFVPITVKSTGNKPVDLMKSVNRRNIMEAEAIGRQIYNRKQPDDMDEMAAGAITIRSHELEEERRAAMLKHKTDIKKANAEAQESVVKRAEQERMDREKQEQAEAV